MSHRFLVNDLEGLRNEKDRYELLVKSIEEHEKSVSLHRIFPKFKQRIRLFIYLVKNTNLTNEHKDVLLARLDILRNKCDELKVANKQYGITNFSKNKKQKGRILFRKYNSDPWAFVFSREALFDLINNKVRLSGYRIIDLEILKQKVRELCADDEGKIEEYIYKINTTIITLKNKPNHKHSTRGHRLARISFPYKKR